MTPHRLLTLKGVDTTYTDAFVESCRDLVRPQYFEPIFGFCMEGGFDRGELVRLANMIPESSSPAYKAHTGAGVNRPARATEREKINNFVLESTLPTASAVFIDRTTPTMWPDGVTDVLRSAVVLPEGVNLIDIARVSVVDADRVRARDEAHVRSRASWRLIKELVERMRIAGYRGPLLSLDRDPVFVRALIWVALTTRVGWTGRVSPRQDLTGFSFDSLQPGRADTIDVFDLLDSSMPNEDGETFGHGAFDGRTLVAYRPRFGGPCYLQIFPNRVGVTRDEIEMSIRTAVAQLAQLPDDLSDFPLELFYAVRKAAEGRSPEEVEAPYVHTTRMLVLAHQYSLFTLRRDDMPLSTIPEPPRPNDPGPTDSASAGADAADADSADGLR